MSAKLAKNQMQLVNSALKKSFLSFVVWGFFPLVADEKLSEDGVESLIREDDSKQREPCN